MSKQFKRWRSIKRMYNARAIRAEERDRVYADAADEAFCVCGWITGLVICPNCHCVRVPEEENR